ncbi:hypothetical protein SDC9_196407 [bioreactor metagenome]|uniref:Uncharacterized protein n=1 Tax=bioreactor metagenome TaxID=1076179 RepID=A0A645IBY8_9ZZZZ
MSYHDMSLRQEKENPASYFLLFAAAEHILIYSRQILLLDYVPKTYLRDFFAYLGPYLRD